MQVGMDVLCESGGDLLKGKRVGLLSHQAAVCRSGASSAQLLRHQAHCHLVALFGPEHGFMGQAAAGAHTHSQMHPDWQIPVHALYGDYRQPTPEMLQGIDVVVCDLQDLGIRCYTYLATLQNMLWACAKAGVSVIVTDRPIPLPTHVEGPLTAPAQISFVAPANLPMLTGLTPGESAQWLRATSSMDLDLTVIPMRAWSRREYTWDATRPPFIPPSPGIKSWEGAMCYPATVFTEALVGIDCGRHTNLAFRVLGAPWFKAEGLCRALHQQHLPGIAFHPYRYVAQRDLYHGQELDGIRLTITDPASYQPLYTSLVLLQTLSAEYGPQSVWHHPKARRTWFDALYGTPRIRLELTAGTAPAVLRDAWQEESQEFLARRQEILCYT